MERCPAMHLSSEMCVEDLAQSGTCKRELVFYYSNSAAVISKFSVEAREEHLVH